MTGPNWKLEDDLKTITVTLPTNPPTALLLDAAGVDDLLTNLGLLRASMKPEIAPTFDLGQKVGAISNPAWLTEPDLMLGQSLLHLRDPRFGWLHYLIPKEEAKKLADLLQNQAAAPPPGQGLAKPN